MMTVMQYESVPTAQIIQNAQTTKPKLFGIHN
jgi:hypothetical protein